MRVAVLHGPRDLRVEERPVPAPGPGEVLVEVSHCGICGTDLHMVVEGWGAPGTIGGHEWSGRVVAVGDDVSSPAVGDGVVGGPPIGCGECAACLQDRPSMCSARSIGGDGPANGAFARYVIAPAQSVVPVPAGLDLRAAALAEPLAVALHAVTQADVSPGDRVLVTGCGPIGALVVAALRARNIDDIVVSEPNEGRQALARNLGAEIVEPDSLEIITIVEPSRIVDDAFDAAIECSGKAIAMEAAFCQLARGGTLVLVGTGLDYPKLDPNRLLLNELIVTGAFEYDARGIDEAVALLASGQIDVDVLIDEADIPLSGLLGAMEALAGGQISGKVLVAPGSNPPNAEAPAPGELQ